MEWKDIGNFFWNGSVPGIVSNWINALTGKNSASDGTYYDSPQDSVADWLGIGSAGREAEWNEQSAENQFEREKELIDKQNDWSARQLQLQRDYQSEREDTYFQRAVQGLQDAGLNPILAAQMTMPSSNSPTAQSAQGVASVLGANGVASGSGLSGLSMLANSALNVFRTGYVINALSRESYGKGVRGVGRAISNVLKKIK